MWRSGLNVLHTNNDGRIRQYAGLLQFTLQTWSGREAACADTGKVATDSSGCGIYADRVAEVGAWAVPAGFAAGADEQFDGGHKLDEQ